MDQQVPHYSSASEGGVIDLITALGEEKSTVIFTAGVVTAVSLAVALLLPPTYTAKTTLLPPQLGQSSSTLAASLGAIAANAGVAAAFKSPEDLYVGLLKTDSVADSLIERLKLKEHYKKESLALTRKELARDTRISSDRKSTLISVQVDAPDAAFAAQVANGYVEELRKLMNRIAVTEAQQRRLFFEQQMVRAKDELAAAELMTQQSQDRRGLVSVDAQIQTMIGVSSQLRGQIIAREAQLQSMRAFAGPDNPDLKRLSSELDALRGRLERIENGPAARNGAAKDSTDALKNVRSFRELKYQEAVYAAMLQQLQLAKADEAKEPPLVQQVDIATAPDRKSAPRLAMIVQLAAAVGVLLGILLAAARRVLRSARKRGMADGRWDALVLAWSFRGRR